MRTPHPLGHVAQTGERYGAPRRTAMIPETLQMLATDPLFPQRDILLDVSAVAQRLAVQLGTCGPLTVAHCERIRETYRFGNCLRVLHRLQVNGRWCVVAARMFPAGRSTEEYQKAAAVAVPCGWLPPVVHDAELHTVFWTFPNDRKISNLPLLMHIPPTLRPLLGPS